VSIYSKDRKGVAMQMFDELPPRLRKVAREKPELSVGFLLVALDDGMTEDEIIESIKGGTSWLIP
jgi:hypothetical protein